MSTRVIIIDRDKHFVKGLEFSLEQDNIIVETANSIGNAVLAIDKTNYSLIILASKLPDGDGITFCESIRKKSPVPIIVLMENEEDIDKILALEHGADDYIVKPFNVLVLKAKIKAVLRRVNMKSCGVKDQMIRIDGLTISALGRKMLIGDKSILLTGKEFDLLYLLASNPGKVYTREMLLKTIWGYEYFGDLRTVDVHIRRLREKIEKELNGIEYIHTRWGVGYYFSNKKMETATKMPNAGRVRAHGRFNRFNNY